MPSTTYATPAQITFLTTLTAERAPDHPLIQRAAAALTIPATVTKRQASALIDAVKQIPATITPEGAPPRPNRYPGNCATCRSYVPANEGRIERSDGRWLTYCLDACTAPSAPAETLNLAKLPEGYYAVPGGDTRLKVRVDRPTDGAWNGYIFISDAAVYGHGRRYGRQAPGGLYSGDIIPELRTFLADPPAAMAAYGRLTGSCGVCNRHLEDETSVALGIGPVCRSRM